jgi:hypothetical protein
MIRKLKTRAFVLPGVIGICSLLLAVSGVLLVKSTETRLSMRKASQINKFHMSMDTVMRGFGAEATQLALGGSTNPSLFSPTNMSNAMFASLPEDLRAAHARSNGTVDIDIGIESYPPGSTMMDLMKSPVEYKNFPYTATRTSFLPHASAGQHPSFAGRRWGVRTSTRVRLRDNLAALEGSWYKRAEDMLGTNTFRKLGQPDSAGHGILTESATTNVITITEIPSQFSVQGQNMDIRATNGVSSTIGGAGGRPSTILGKNVVLITNNLDLHPDRRLIARARLADKDAHSTASEVNHHLRSGMRKEQELEEAGSTLLVPVGTRGPEIFRPGADYVKTLEEIDHIDQKKAATLNVGNHLPYWLPYYQCNLRVVVRVPSGTSSPDPTAPPSSATSPAYPYSDLANDSETFSVTASFAPEVSIPASRASNIVPNPPPSFGSMLVQGEPVNRFGRAALPLIPPSPGPAATPRTTSTTTPAPPSASAILRPISVVSRFVYYDGASSPGRWINTIDVDLSRLMDMALADNLNNLDIKALAIHIDIRGPNGDAYLPNAADFPVVIRQASTLKLPVSIVTPGTIYFQESFATQHMNNISTGGGTRPHPYSIFAPKVRYGMISRTPTSVGIRGQRMTVGGAVSTDPSAPLAVVSGAERPAPNAVNIFANVEQPATGAGSGSSAPPLIPPVHLKDWLVETFNIWVDQ